MYVKEKVLNDHYDIVAIVTKYVSNPLDKWPGFNQPIAERKEY